VAVAGRKSVLRSRILTKQMFKIEHHTFLIPRVLRQFTLDQGRPLRAVRACRVHHSQACTLWNAEACGDAPNFIVSPVGPNERLLRNRFTLPSLLAELMRQKKTQEAAREST
jgi:hypothetical protein